MGFLDVLTGRRKLDKPAPDRLFAISTAYVTFQTSLGLSSRGCAAIVFQSLATADFNSIVKDSIGNCRSFPAAFARAEASSARRASSASSRPIPSSCPSISLL